MDTKESAPISKPPGMSRELNAAERFTLARALAHDLEWETFPVAPSGNRLANLAEDVRRLLDGDQPAHDWNGFIYDTYPPAVRSLLALIVDHRPRCTENCTINFIALLPIFETLIGRSATDLERWRFM